MNVFTIATVFTDSASTPVVTSIPAQGAETTADFVEKFLNMDFINNVLVEYAKVFSIGFAFATVLALITFGVFKAFSLVRIE
nr:hypothetical protein [uncultured Blautia sp.]